jgi:hypothetical protein
MKAKRKENRLLLASVCFAIACPLEINSLIQFTKHLPVDWVGITLYVLTIVGFALIAVGCYAEWARRGGDPRFRESSLPRGTPARGEREPRASQVGRAQSLQGKQCRAG